MPAERRAPGGYTFAMASTPAWHTDTFPELRAAPPWVMQEMIEVEPDLLERSRPPPTPPRWPCC